MPVMERVKRNNKEYLVGYHTQEYRVSKVLTAPIRCQARNAWLGIGYYFWTEEEFARFWGEDKKKSSPTGCYDIYKAHLDTKDCIDTVFSEEGYNFFCSKIAEVITYFKSKGENPTLEKVNRYLADNVWIKLNITGIIYDDKPTNSKTRTHSLIPDLYYKKRIQVVIFGLSQVSNFEIFKEEQD